MKPTTERFAFMELERYLAGELDAQKSRAIEAAAETDQELGRWLAERKAEQRAFLLDPRRRNFASLLEEAGASRGTKSRRWLPLFGWATAAMAAVMIGVAVLVPAAPEIKIRHKGGLSVRTAVLEDGNARLLQGSRALRPGDRLRLTVEDARGGFVTVLLQESSGDVQVVYAPAELGKLSPGSHELPGSLELDRAIGRERLWVIMSDEAPDVATWEKELEGAQQKTGFDHGWLPAGQARVSTVEYTKVNEK